MTFMPLPGSQLIDHGNNDLALAFDQRGAERIVDGDKDGTPTVDIGPVEFDPRLLSIRLEAIDGEGRTVTELLAGSEFYLRGYVADVRDDPRGVFASYFDLVYDESLATVTGQVEFPGDFENVLSGDVSVAGLIDEVGGVASLTPDVGEQLVFSVLMRTTDPGTLNITSNPADLLPHHDSLLIDLNKPLAPADIRFGRLSIEVLPPVIGNDDIVAADEDHIAIIDPAANDVGDDVRITVFDGTTARGAVVTSNEDGTLSYDPRSASSLQGLDSGETLQDTFTYTVTDSHGTTATATVTIDVSGVNDAPAVSSSLQGQLTESTLMPTLVFSFTFHADSFRDAEGDPLNYEAQLQGGASLPSWLSFDPATRTFLGTPQLADLGTYTITVTATDDGDPALAVADQLQIQVVNPYRNPTNVYDVNADGFVTPLDALLIINRMNATGPGRLVLPPTADTEIPPYVDVNGDLYISPIDALLVMNRINQPNAEGEFAAEELESDTPIVFWKPEGLLTQLASDQSDGSSALYLGSVDASVGSLSGFPSPAGTISSPNRHDDAESADTRDPYGLLEEFESLLDALAPTLAAAGV
jgi:VCBS repeat-containing protein